MKKQSAICLHWASTAIAVAVLSSLAAAALQAKPSKVLYPDPAEAKKEIQVALVRAKREHKRVILDFGGNWCGDCRALDKYFHQEPNASLLKKRFVLVDVNIERFNANLDVAATYGVPIQKGVPALAVLDSSGKTLYSQKNGEFESMGRMESSSVTEFLRKWQP